MKAVYLVAVVAVAVVMLSQPEPSEGGLLDDILNSLISVVDNVIEVVEPPAGIDANLIQNLVKSETETFGKAPGGLKLIKIVDVNNLWYSGEQLNLVETLLQDSNGNSDVCNVVTDLDGQRVRSYKCYPEVPLVGGLVPYPSDAPQPIPGVCYLPSDHGPCFALFRKWFYNDASGHCEEFYYGGCQGNANNFDTERDCNRQCVCSQSKDPGLCYASMPRWYFNNNTNTCEQFTYGGCGGNGNNFLTRDQCLQSC